MEVMELLPKWRPIRPDRPEPRIVSARPAAYWLVARLRASTAKTAAAAAAAPAPAMAATIAG